MKKLTLVFSIFVIVVSINSCSKTKGCTDKNAPNYNAAAEEDDGSCIDWTENIVGTYTGTYADSIAGVVGQTTTTQTIVVSKINNSSVRLTSQSGDVVSFDATIVTSNSAGTVFTIPTFTDGSLTFEGLNQTILGITAAGAVQGNTLVYLIRTTDGSLVQSFQGTK